MLAGASGAGNDNIMEFNGSEFVTGGNGAATRLLAAMTSSLYGASNSRLTSVELVNA